jgi:hypothetical protein
MHDNRVLSENMHDISHFAGLRDISIFGSVVCYKSFQICFDITEEVHVNLGSSSAATEGRGILSESSSSEDSESDDSLSVLSVLSSSSSIMFSCFISSNWKYEHGFASWEIGDGGTSIIPVQLNSSGPNSSTAVKPFLELC